MPGARLPGRRGGAHGQVAGLGCRRMRSPDRRVSARNRANAPLQSHRQRGMSRAVLALDQGTTGSAALVFDDEANVLASADLEIGQSYPQPGWVEHDPEEILATTVAAGRAALDRAGAANGVAAIGITNQRETTVVWDRATGTPIYPAVVWQSRASASICERLKADGLEGVFRERTGLLIDAYFSGTKIRWLLDRVEGAQQRAEAGELLFGTIDSWLVWKLSGGRVHCTDVSNASRTLLFNIDRLAWDDELDRKSVV